MTAMPSGSSSDSNLTPYPARAVIVGAGAVGAHLAASLRPGVRLLIVDQCSEVRKAFNARGIETAELGGAASESGPFQTGDVAILATSASRVASVGAKVPPWVPLICVANGLDTGLDPARPGGLTFGVIEFGASSSLPGHARCTRKGWLTLPRGSSDAEWLARSLDSTRQRTRLVHDLPAHRWGKLMLNASLDPVAAIIGGTLGTVFSGRQSFTAFRALLREALAVAQASHWRLAPIQGLTPRGLHRVFSTPFTGRLAARLASRQARAVESTLAREIARGELGEADQLSGAIIRQGAIVGVATPAHSRALDLLHRLARSGRCGQPDLACELVACSRPSAAGVELPPCLAVAPPPAS
jgi:2-dehydropantoate 2-reductase